MFNECFWIFLHFHLVKFFLSYWIFLCFYLIKKSFSPIDSCNREQHLPICSLIFDSPSGTIHKPFSTWTWKNWALAVFFLIWMGEKKDPFIRTKADLPWTHPFCKLLTVLSLPVTFKWESRRHHQTLWVETKDVNPTHKRPFKQTKKYIHKNQNMQTLSFKDSSKIHCYATEAQLAHFRDLNRNKKNKTDPVDKGLVTRQAPCHLSNNLPTHIPSYWGF